MLIFALIHDENDDHQSQVERMDLFDVLWSNGIHMTQKCVLDRQIEREALEAQWHKGQQQQQQDQQQQQQNPDVVLSGVVYVIDHATAFSSVISATFGAWLHGRYGRKVRIKVGDIEAEAQTEEQLEKLLKMAHTIQLRNETKKILS